MLVCFGFFTPECTLGLMNANRRAKSSKHAGAEQPADERYAAEGWSGPQPRVQNLWEDGFTVLFLLVWNLKPSEADGKNPPILCFSIMLQGQI